MFRGHYIAANFYSCTNEILAGRGKMYLGDVRFTENIDKNEAGTAIFMARAIGYMEENLTEELTVAQIAKHTLISPFYFQKGFSMLCGFPVGDYIRQRRLALAGSELTSTDARVIDLTLKYGYDSRDSFTKAFTRFHGITPTAARKGGRLQRGEIPQPCRLQKRRTGRGVLQRNLDSREEEIKNKLPCRL